MASSSPPQRCRFEVGSLDWTHDLIFPCSSSSSSSSDLHSGQSCVKWLNVRRRRSGVQLVATTSAFPEIQGSGRRRRFLNKTPPALKFSTTGTPPTLGDVLRQPLLGVCWVQKEVLLFAAGAFAGAVAKTVTAPLDRVKILLQVDAARTAQTQLGSKGAVNFLEAVVKVGTSEGIAGFWRGNLPQIIRIIPYSAVQLLSYEVYKKFFKGTNEELSIIGRLSAGACAGMTSTLVTYPLDTLRFRMALDPGAKTMRQVAMSMLRDEGVASLYRGLGPSLLGIAPYIALNFCIFDLIKKSLPEELAKKPVAAFATALTSATLATTICYPLDTVRRQMQLKGSPFTSVMDAIPAIINRDGVSGLYRGFVPNALKNLPNNSIRLTTFDAAKNLIQASQVEYEKLQKSRNDQTHKTVDNQEAA